jgi:putative ABC transport system permease protein
MFVNYLKIALKVLARRKFFTFISLFGISFTLIVLMVVAALLDHYVLPSAPEVHRDRTLQISYMMMSGEENEWYGPPGYGFLDRYCRNLPGVERMTIVQTGESSVAYRNGERIEFQLRRTDGEYWSVLDFEFLEGGPFSVEDDREERPVAVISEAMRRSLFDGAPAVGRFVELTGQSFEVVGVVANVGPTHQWAHADVWVPIGTIADSAFRPQLMGRFQALLLARSRDAFPGIREDFQTRLPRIEFPDPETYDKMEGRLLSQVESLASNFISAEPSPARIARFLALAGALVFGFMLLPAINLVNINLSRIYERMSEIGVRKAFGASSSHLVRQFVLENIVLCLVGGIIGFALAGLVLTGINSSGAIPHSGFSLNLRVFGVGMALAVFFGVLSGIYPAWRMSRLHPVVALRGEIS